MRNTIIILHMVLFVAISLVISEFVLGEDKPAKKKPRWDEVMIKEASVWNNLLVRHTCAEHRKYWPERKAALKKILDKFPDSRWADDAALILACGKAGFEDDPNGAIKDLYKVAQQYPNSHTVVVSWYPNTKASSSSGCRLDDTWLRGRASLVFLNKDGTIRKAFPFDRHGPIVQLDRELLTYFNHLDDNPRRTKVLAHTFIARILAQKGDMAGAITLREQIVKSTKKELVKILKADAIAASGPTGYYIRQLLRPEFHAYMSLIYYYEKEGKTDKALAKADELAGLVRGTFNWRILELLGELYDKHGLKTKAAEQYRSALVGIEQHIQGEKERIKRLEYAGTKKAEVSPYLKRAKVKIESVIKEKFSK